MPIFLTGGTQGMVFHPFLSTVGFQLRTHFCEFVIHSCYGKSLISSRIGSRCKWECHNSSHLIGSSLGQCFSSLPTWRVFLILMGTMQILRNQLRISELAGKWRTMQISSRGGGKCMQINLYFLVHRSQASLPLKLLLAFKWCSLASFSNMEAGSAIHNIMSLKEIKRMKWERFQLSS